jgi:hypothetical protein
VQSRPTGQCALDVCAALAALRGEWTRAARFFGAVEAQTAEGGYHRDPADNAFLAPLIARARDTLGAQSFEGAEAQGRTLSYDDAIDEARAWLARLDDRAASGITAPRDCALADCPRCGPIPDCRNVTRVHHAESKQLEASMAAVP